MVEVTRVTVGPKAPCGIDQLAAGANEGALDAQGRSEYEALINASEFVSILKLKARQQLRTNAA